jgi:hypothetical protein
LSTTAGVTSGVVALMGIAACIGGPLLGPESYVGRDLVIFGLPVAMIGGLGVVVSLLYGLFKSPNRPPAAGTPGWHPDPYDASSLRYFDGNSWTGHTAPRHPTA